MKLLRSCVPFFCVLFLFIGCQKEKVPEVSLRVITPAGGTISFFDYYYNDQPSQWSSELVRLEAPAGAVEQDVVVDMKVLCKGFYGSDFKDSNFVAVPAHDSIIKKTKLKTYLFSDYTDFVMPDGAHLIPLSKFIYFDPATTQFKKPVKVTLPYYQPKAVTVSPDSLYTDYRFTEQDKYLYGLEGMFRLYSFDLFTPNEQWNEVANYTVDTVANTVTFEITDFSSIYGLGFVDITPIRKDYMIIQTSKATDMLLQYTSAGKDTEFGLVTFNGLNQFLPGKTLVTSNKLDYTWYDFHLAFPENQTGILTQNTLFKIHCYQNIAVSGSVGFSFEIVNTYSGNNISVTVNNVPQIGQQLSGSISGDLVSDSTGAVLHIEGNFSFTKTR